MRKIKAKTKYVSYVGVEDENGVISFKGIPYAKPPIGKLRWKEPMKPEVGDDVFEALDFGRSCVQPINELAPASLGEQGEDCLNLNIWTRNISTEKKPVMVYIHGGSYIGSGASDPWYYGDNFVKRHDIVFVTIDYRCNVLGFMDLEEIGGREYKDSKNLGIIDQICALEWIKENIPYFGGDPDNVTVFGESAGGISVSLLLTMPRAKGLFHKAIVESGTLNMHKSLQKSREQAKDFLKHAGANTIEELLLLSQDEIRDACINLMVEYGYKSEIMFAPVADGELIPLNPYECIQNGCAKDIKLMIGTTADEVCYWKLYYDDIESQAGHILEDECNMLSLNIEKYENEINGYLAMQPDVPMVDRYLSLFSDLMFRIPSIKLAENQCNYEDTWMYIFAWPSKVEGFGACHAIELPFVFHNEENPDLITFAGDHLPTSLADMTQDAWVAFAKTGNPSHSGIPVWPKYDAEKRQTMIIHEKWHVEEDPGKEKRLNLRNIFE